MFYKCLICGNIIYLTNGNENNLQCCGKSLIKLEGNTTEAALEKHIPQFIVENNKIIVTVGEILHPMEIDHYIMWIAMIYDNNIEIHHLKPGDEPKTTFEFKENTTIYAYCNKHGLWKNEI